MSQDTQATALLDLPVNEAVNVDGIQIRLQISDSGAVLSAELGIELTAESTQRCLELGFSNALEFDAGLAMNAARRHLLLTRWLPDVTAWSDAENALESLLNQVDVFHAVLQKSNVKKSEMPARGLSRQEEEKRLRARFLR